jgi:hypothetical protein
VAGQVHGDAIRLAVVEAGEDAFAGSHGAVRFGLSQAGRFMTADEPSAVVTVQASLPNHRACSKCATPSRLWDNPIPSVKQRRGPAFPSGRSFRRKPSQLR